MSIAKSKDHIILQLVRQQNKPDNCLSGTLGSGDIGPP